MKCHGDNCRQIFHQHCLQLEDSVLDRNVTVYCNRCEDEYIHTVGGILEHRVTRNGVCKFRVKWKHHKASKNTWEPLELIRENVQLDLYLARTPAARAYVPEAMDAQAD